MDGQISGCSSYAVPLAWLMEDCLVVLSMEGWVPSSTQPCVTGGLHFQAFLHTTELQTSSVHLLGLFCCLVNCYLFFRAINLRSGYSYTYPCYL